MRGFLIFSKDLERDQCHETSEFFNMSVMSSKYCEELIMVNVKGTSTHLTNRKIKDSFHFAEEIVDQQHDVFMGSLDVESLFTTIALEETIDICTNQLFKEFETVEGLKSLNSFCLSLLRIHILFLMGHFINKSMEWLRVPP